MSEKFCINLNLYESLDEIIKTSKNDELKLLLNNNLYDINLSSLADRLIFYIPMKYKFETICDLPMAIDILSSNVMTTVIHDTMVILNFNYYYLNDLLEIISCLNGKIINKIINSTSDINIKKLYNFADSYTKLVKNNKFYPELLYNNLYDCLKDLYRETDNDKISFLCSVIKNKLNRFDISCNNGIIEINSDKIHPASELFNIVKPEQIIEKLFEFLTDDNGNIIYDIDVNNNNTVFTVKWENIDTVYDIIEIFKIIPNISVIGYNRN